MPRFCSTCGAQISETAGACPACGTSINQPASQATTAPGTGGLSDNVAGLLAYVTIIPAVIFLVMEPYNKNRFIRFHAFQAIFFNLAWIVLWVALSMVGMVPVLGWATLLVWPLLGLGGLALWIVLLVKAYGGQMWKLPVIGDMAQKQANSVPPAPRESTGRAA